MAFFGPFLYTIRNHLGRSKWVLLPMLDGSKSCLQSAACSVHLHRGCVRGMLLYKVQDS